MSTHTPYVGVTGFTSRPQVRLALHMLPDCGRQLMVGVLVSQKTLHVRPNRYPRRYPARERVARVFLKDLRCLNLVHYASDVPPDWETIVRLIHWSGPRCHGFQFNMTWPCAADLERLYHVFDRPLRIVLQARPTANAWIPSHSYRGLITDILVDGSGGRGVRLDGLEMAEYCCDVRRRWPDVNVGVAGGLCAKTVGEVAGLLRSGANVDAEWRLRDAADNLDVDAVGAYLRKVGEILDGGRFSGQEDGYGR